MFDIAHRRVLASAVTVISGALLVSFTPTLAMADSGAPPARTSRNDSSSTGVTIAIPMVAVPHLDSTKSAASPNVVITENCGTAFLFVSNGYDHVHYDFGFWGLSNGTFWVNASIGTINDDNGEVDGNSWSNAYFGSTWEQQGDLYTDTGGNDVSAYIYSFGALYDCVSSSALSDFVYVY